MVKTNKKYKKKYHNNLFITQRVLTHLLVDYHFPLNMQNVIRDIESFVNQIILDIILTIGNGYGIVPNSHTAHKYKPTVGHALPCVTYYQTQV